MANRVFRGLVASGLLGLVGCGGGGGGGDGGNGGGGPPTPDPITFQASLTGLELVDDLTDENIEASGLPLAGAIVSLDP